MLGLPQTTEVKKDYSQTCLIQQVSNEYSGAEGV